MTVNEIMKNAGIKEDVAESIYWHCIWLRYAPADAKVQWQLLFKDKNYRLTGKVQEKK